jgi:hypothetical protein
MGAVEPTVTDRFGAFAYRHAGAAQAPASTAPAYGDATAAPQSTTSRGPRRTPH